jgi:hypothetical protein
MTNRFPPIAPTAPAAPAASRELVRQFLPNLPWFELLLSAALLILLHQT